VGCRSPRLCRAAISSAVDELRPMSAWKNVDAVSGRVVRVDRCSIRRGPWAARHANATPRQRDRAQHPPPGHRSHSAGTSRSPAANTPRPDRRLVRRSHDRASAPSGHSPHSPHSPVQGRFPKRRDHRPRPGSAVESRSPPDIPKRRSHLFGPRREGPNTGCPRGAATVGDGPAATMRRQPWEATTVGGGNRGRLTVTVRRRGTLTARSTVLRYATRFPECFLPDNPR